MAVLKKSNFYRTAVSRITGGDKRRGEKGGQRRGPHGEEGWMNERDLEKKSEEEEVKNDLTNDSVSFVFLSFCFFFNTD